MRFDLAGNIQSMKTAWESASKTGDTLNLLALVAQGADLNARDRHGQTALMRAAHAGHGDVVELLIARRADLNVTAKYGLSALMLAIVSGHASIARRLAEAGADLSLRGSGAPGFFGKTARDLALAQGMTGLSAILEPEL